MRIGDLETLAGRLADDIQALRASNQELTALLATERIKNEQLNKGMVTGLEDLKIEIARLQNANTDAIDHLRGIGPRIYRALNALEGK